MPERIRRPAYQFYPNDEEREAALRLVSLAAYGLWRRMLNLMHEGVPYGHLTTGSGHAIDVAQLARIVSESPATVKKLLAELEDNGVFSRTEAGVIYSRRMVRDEHIRTVRAAAGRQGGNPNLVKQNGKQRRKQNPTPSSSSSSSEREPLQGGSLSSPGGALGVPTPHAAGENGARRPLSPMEQAVEEKFSSDFASMVRHE